jgi:hypothetical protein
MAIQARIQTRFFASLAFVASLLAPAAVKAQSTGASQVFDQDKNPRTIVRYAPLTREERVNWFVKSTIGPPSLAGGVISSAWGTAFNNPEEYGPHWDGFAKRYGLRLTGVAASNAMEVSLGSLTGEDPRYKRSGRGGMKSRIGQAAKMTVLAAQSDGSIAPAYARYGAIAGSNFLSNTWRPDSDSTVSRALLRTGLGFAGRFVGNIFEEFWPDAKSKFFGGNKGGDRSGRSLH